ncbi:M23 family metallopeptidase [Dinghuibacter silviterrae]|uniref:Murein DD-endopeptidase MepM/ murein hydrolase activator NlpD n=1 Tax=Dinghuibacter silviterrae TaxID=1539049 RepID=A0A4R8DQS9_9BACT|nr:M23 family metallopeptidase [Dinghuibacter silviterrae]TDW99480.1 murein DD-endopeptidase MepM/ murein hydrolase activator NlpD [Dinghuibacter silviterrae]
MKKIKYYYNTNTLRYEKLVVPLRVKLLRVLGFLSAVFVSGLIIVSIAFQYVPSPKEQIIRSQFSTMREHYDELNTELEKLKGQMGDLEKRDNSVYRSIFEASPIPDSAREKAMASEAEQKLVESMGDDDLASSIAQSMSTLANRMNYEKKSYDDIDKMIANKQLLLAATPAIQPVSNKDLTRVASGYGYRIDPIYKTTKFHAGLDFTAPQGTPIYATANGTVAVAGFTEGGYGNHVVINHGYGYETLYGHMYKVIARVGQVVKRGEVIGYVGSTGKSTGPHCHYEVHKNGSPVDPIYFFYNDLSPEQFDRILKLSKASNQSFD